MKIIQVQKQRGRSSNVLKVTDDKGQVLWVPKAEGNRHYRMVQEWLTVGGEILSPEPKPSDPDQELAYKEHPNFKLPEESSTAVWRYMNASKSISLLENESLFFSRGSALVEGDKKEGSLPEENLKANPESLFSNLFGKSNIEGLNPHQIEQAIQGHRRMTDLFGNFILINCWHLNQHESYPFWKVYGGGGNSIAIKSNIDRLKRCFGKYADYNIYIGEISYIDYSNDVIDERNLLNLFLHKRHPFKDEREVRCILYDDGDIGLFSEDEPDPSQLLMGEKIVLGTGVNVPIDIGILVEEIYVSPFSSNEFL